MDIQQENNFVAVERPKNLSIQVADQLMTAINQGVFSNGDYLPSENKLVEIFEVSRGVIREALLMLSAKGIIEIQKGKGARLLSPSIDHLLDPFSLLINYKCGNKGLKYTQEVRFLIEPQIASLAAKFRKEEDLEKMRKCIINMEEYKEDRKLLSFYDVEFHKIIARSCGNPMFSVIMEPIFHFLQTYHQEMFVGKPKKEIDVTSAEHEHILIAIEMKDSKAASDIMKRHFTVASKTISNILGS